ncbi:hypothetical protein, partial [Flavisericum labens]|uniref:hypothetical protein n=1 Tax=Flavisericum labens TaxID=3377112 RepID=UPI00387A90D0
MRTQILLNRDILCFLKILIGLGMIYSVKAQSFFYPNFVDYTNPSPNATAFTIYGDYPVDYNTGITDMRIPIYTIKSGSLTLPIDMSFHASGRKLNESNGFLGVRWALNTGGIITRTVHGYPDEWNRLTPFEIPSGSIPSETSAYWGWNASDINYSPSLDVLIRSCSEGTYSKVWMPEFNYFDSEYDVFKYQLPSGKSGKFILKKENGIKTVMTMPFDPIKIELNKADINPKFYMQITITDVDGTSYNYGSKNDQDYLEYPTESSLPSDISKYPTGWYLESIVSADKLDTISFTYSGVSSYTLSNYGKKLKIYDRIDNSSVSIPYFYEGSCGAEDTFGPQLLDHIMLDDPLNGIVAYDNNVIYDVPVLSSIQFKNGILNFNYKDTYDEEFSYNKKILEDITLEGFVNKKFKFNIEGNNGQLRYLKSFETVSIINNLEKVEKIYGFDYYKPPTSSIDNLTGYKSSKDWWGYYNINVGDKLLPLQNIAINGTAPYGCVYGCVETIGQNGVNRDPDLESMRYGMLKSITYPTKGKTEFEYENNYYRDGIDIKKGPGLRIGKITNYPNIGPNDKIVRTFKYGQNEDGVGNINELYKPLSHWVRENEIVNAWDYPNCSGYWYYDFMQYRNREFCSDNVLGSSDFGGNIIYYDVVNEYVNENSNKSLRTEYIYHTKYSATGKNGYEEFSRTGVGYPSVFFTPFNEFSTSFYMDAGKLKSKTLFNNNDDTYVPLQKESYFYLWGLHDVAWDMPTRRHIYFSFNSNYYFDDTRSRYDFEMDWGVNTIDYGFRKYVSSSVEYSHKEIEYYNESGNVDLTTDNLVYNDPQYGQVKTQESANSDGKVIRTEYEYPFEDVSVPINNK